MFLSGSERPLLPCRNAGECPSCLSPFFPHLLPQTPPSGPAAPRSAVANHTLFGPKSDTARVTVHPRRGRSCCKPRPPPPPVGSIGQARSPPPWEGFPELKGLAPACGRSLPTNSCFRSSRLGRNPPASTANTAIRSCPCQLSSPALQPTRPLASPSPSPARAPLRARRHQSRVLAQGDQAEPDPGSGCPGDVPSMAFIPPPRHAGSVELCQNTSEGDAGAKARAQPPLANCFQQCGCERTSPPAPLHPRDTSVTPQAPGMEVLTLAAVNGPAGLCRRARRREPCPVRCTTRARPRCSGQGTAGGGCSGRRGRSRVWRG